MRAIIIEDEPLSVAELRTTLAEVAPQIEVVATASSVAEAAAVIAGVGHDLIFMDIHLGDGSGFDIFPAHGRSPCRSSSSRPTTPMP